MQFNIHPDISQVIGYRDTIIIMHKVEPHLDLSLNLEKLGFPFNSVALKPPSVELWQSKNLELTFPNFNEEQLGLLKEEVGFRRELLFSVKDIFQKLEDSKKSLGQLLLEKNIDNMEVSKLFKLLSDFISKDENHGRIILYLPFELLLNLEELEDISEDLLSSYSQFVDSYKLSWFRLLHESEPRANFIDGDILEPGLGEPERIRKVAHLIPELLSNKILSEEDIENIVNDVNEYEILRSVADGLQAALELEYVQEDDVSITRSILARKGILIEVKKRDMLGEKSENKNLVLEDAFILIEQEIEESESKRQKIAPNVSQKRIDWQKQLQTEETIKKFAKKLMMFMQKGESSMKEIEAFLLSDGGLEIKRELIIRTIFMTLELEVTQNPDNAKKLFKVFSNIIETLWTENKDEVQSVVSSGLSHLYKLKIIDEDILNKFTTSSLDLSLAFPIDLEELVLGEASSLIKISKKIEEHPQLSQYFYPNFLVFGSRIKGYAATEADLDVAMFIRPEVNWEQRDHVLSLLYAEFPELKNLDKILEFWVDKKGDGYSFKQNSDIPSVVGAPQIHFLMGGVWVGTGEETGDMYKNIMHKYLDLGKFGEHKDKVRLQLLRQLELDMLQYRLLHKGYDRYYPQEMQEDTSECKSIDGESTYWDSGYRRIATQLFLNRVFLPDLSE